MDDFIPPHVTVSLRVTVPAPEVPRVMGRLGTHLADLLRAGGEAGGPLPFAGASVDVYLAEQDTEE